MLRFRRAIALVFGILLSVNPAIAYGGRLAIQAVPNDPFYSRQTYLAPIRAENAWSLSTGSQSVIVAVIDTGVDIRHPDLAANIWTNPREVAGNGIDDDGNGYVDDLHGWDFVTGTPDPTPKFTEGANPGGMQHGTIVAGIIGAVGSNSVGVTGINWSVRIMPLRLLDGSGVGSSRKVAEALRYAVHNGASVVNLSFTSESLSTDIQEAIAEAYAQGVLVVTAAGNQIFTGGQDLDVQPIYPACMRGPNGEKTVLAVAATTNDDHKSDFSNYGKCVDLSAPGEDVFGTQFVAADHAGFTDAYGGGWSGTSVSSPMVAGAAALLKSLTPQISPKELMTVLRETADPIDHLNPDYAGKLGRGRLNIRAAVERVLSIPPKGLVREERTVVARAAGSAPLVQVFNAQGLLVGSFAPYAATFRGGVRVAVADTDGDGSDDIVTVPGPGIPAVAKVFSMTGQLKMQFPVFPALFLRGATVAAADLNRDGKAEIVIGAGPGAGSRPQVRVFRADGFELGGFDAFDPTFRGGVQVALADLDGDSVPEIVAGMYSGGRQVRGFNADGALTAVFPDPTSPGDGVTLAALDSDQNGRDEVAVGMRKDGALVQIMEPNGRTGSAWQAGPKLYKGLLELGGASRSLKIRDTLLVGLQARKNVSAYGADGKLRSSMQVYSLAPLGGFTAALGSVSAE